MLPVPALEQGFELSFMAQTLPEHWASELDEAPALIGVPSVVGWWAVGSRRGNCVGGPRTGKLAPLGTQSRSEKASQRVNT